MRATPHQVPTAEGVPLLLVPAGPGSRAAAFLLDALVQLAALGALFGLVGTVATRLGSAQRADWQLAGTLLAAVGLGVGVLLVWAWPTFFELVWRGQTPGKRALGLRVVERDGGLVGWRATLLRNLLRPADLLPGLGLVGLVAACVDPQRRRLGDLVAGTLVIRDESRPRPRVQGLACPLPPTWTSRRLRVALGPDLLALIAETLEREALSEQARARLEHGLAERVRTRLADPVPDADGALLRAVLARSRQDQRG